MSLVSLDSLPHHVAIIMDGNGRWAKRVHKPRTVGHREGSKAVRRTVRACRRLGIHTLTLYAFAEQNWLRPVSEVSALMDLFREYLISEREEVLCTGIKFEAIGRIYRLPKPLQTIIADLIRDTQHLDGMRLQLAVSYGGQEEILDAVKGIVQGVTQGEVNPDLIDEKIFSSYLPSLKGGPVDLLIRTSGEYRISNFLLWGAAYAELYFTNILWPDFDENELYKAIAAFQQRERRYGRVRDDDKILDDSNADSFSLPHTVHK